MQKELSLRIELNIIYEDVSGLSISTNKLNSMPIRIANLVTESVVDGPGIRFTVFVQGCDRRCLGCHNPSTFDKNGGTLMQTDYIIEEIKKNTLLDGVTLSGGEPFNQAAACAIIAIECKMLSLNIISYSGHYFEELYDKAKDNPDWDKLLRLLDILVDGPFILEQRSLLLAFRGSKNQRLVNVPSSLKNFDCGDRTVIFC